MKKLIAAVAASAAILPLCAAEENAPVVTGEAPGVEEDGGTESPLEFKFKLDVMSVYMWRGMLLDKNPCYQPSAEITYSGDYGSLTANYWTSLDLTHKRNTYSGNSRRFGSMVEQDIFIGYENEYEIGDLGKIVYGIGHYIYDYPYNGKTNHSSANAHHHAGSFCGDLDFTIAWKNDYVTPKAECLWAYGTSHDHEPATAYWLLSLEKEIAIEQIEGLTITPSASLGIGNIAFVQLNTGVGDSHTQLTDQTLSLAAEYEINKFFSVGANINYTWTPSRTLRHQRFMSLGDDNAHQLIWGGVSATFKF